MPIRKPPCPPNCPLRRPACQGSCPDFQPYVEQLKRDKIAKQEFIKKNSDWTQAKDKAHKRRERYLGKKAKGEVT